MFCEMAPYSMMTLEHVSRSNQETLCPPQQTTPSEIYVCGSGRQQQCPVCLVLVKNYTLVTFWPWRRFALFECCLVILVMHMCYRPLKDFPRLFLATTTPLSTSCPLRNVSFNAMAYRMTASCRNGEYLSPCDTCDMSTRRQPRQGT